MAPVVATNIIAKIATYNKHNNDGGHNSYNACDSDYTTADTTKAATTALTTPTATTAAIAIASATRTIVTVLKKATISIYCGPNH